MAGVAKGAKDCCLISLMVGLGGAGLKTGLGGCTGSEENGFAAKAGFCGLPTEKNQ